MVLALFVELREFGAALCALAQFAFVALAEACIPRAFLGPSLATKSLAPADVSRGLLILALPAPKLQ